MKKLVLTLVAVFAIGLPGAAAAQVLDPGSGGGGGCAYGTIYGSGDYSGVVPYYATNSYVQIETTFRNLNSLGFAGDVHIWTYSGSDVGQSIWLMPWWAPGSSVTIRGPEYTTNPVAGMGVPYHIHLFSYSDQTALAYQVCV